MSKKTCPACGAPVSPGDEFCGFCGALIPRNKAVGQTEQASAAAVQAAPAPEAAREKRRVQTPQTIEELLAFCQRHELPLSKMRFFSSGWTIPARRPTAFSRTQTAISSSTKTRPTAAAPCATAAPTRPTP